MPSYRTILTVTTMAPGHRPEDVEAAARSVTRLESVRGVAEVPRSRLAAVVRGRSHYLTP